MPLIRIFILLCSFISLSLFGQREATDCVNFIQICGNQTISLNPAGSGVQELNYYNVCNGTENNSLWIRFTVKTSGTLGFDLIPDSSDINVDYDFWIFGPNVSCSNFGSAIRCSTTNPKQSGAANNHTGMRDSEPDGDFSEGPGSDGDNYIKSLNVVAGESYFLLIDRPIGDSSFKLNWTGTANLEDPFGTAPKAFGVPSSVEICNINSTLDFSTFDARILNNNPDFEVYYYNSNEDASYDQNRLTGITTIESKKYYYRIQSLKTHCFQVGSIDVIRNPLVLKTDELKACSTNGLGIFNLLNAKLTDDAIDQIHFYETRVAAENHISGTEISNPTAYTSAEKTVYAWVKLIDGCEAVTEVKLSFFSIPNVNVASFNSEFCDDDFDGKISVQFAAITSTIVQNSSDFDVIYTLVSDPRQTLPNSWSFSQDTDVQVEVKSKNGCPSAFGIIHFKIKPRLLVDLQPHFDICDSDLSGKEDVNLFDLAKQIANYSQVSYFETRSDAWLNKKSISENQTISADSDFYFRWKDASGCDEITHVSLTFNQSRKSEILKDVVICPSATTTLDAGAGYSAYAWSNGSKTASSGDLAVGKYWVDLFVGNCSYRQHVEVLAESSLIITDIKVKNNTATISVEGGSSAYEYSLDGVHWFSSPVFTNLAYGIHKAYVRNQMKCEVVSAEFLNLNLINAITPNDDGINDHLDFSGLKIKKDVRFLVFDRFGKEVFQAKENSFVWDGKSDLKRPLPSGTYWYILEWIEPLSGVKMQFHSWILLKNRN